MSEHISNKKTFISNKIQSYYKNKTKQKNSIDNLKNKRINDRQKGGFNIIYSNITSRIFKTFKRNNIVFNLSYEEIIGCTKNQLQEYIIEKLKDSMTIENYGNWEIDHIIPVSSFDFSIKDNIHKCFNYRNLQPLWKLENRKKSNNIIAN